MHPTVTGSHLTLLEATLKAHTISDITCFGEVLSLYYSILEVPADPCPSSAVLPDCEARSAKALQMNGDRA